MERIKVYFEAIGFLIGSFTEWFMEKLEDEKYFSHIFLVFLFLLGWAMIYYPYVIISFTLLSPFIFVKDIGVTKVIWASIIFVSAVFVVSLLIGLLYDKNIKKESVVTNITNPKYEVTSKSNFIMQEGDSSQILELSDKKFAIIKNSNCKSIQKVKITKSKPGFPDIYSDIDSELRCDGKVIK